MGDLLESIGGSPTMSEILEVAESGEIFYEDSTTDSWKQGEKVPVGYRVVFGKLRKVGGGSHKDYGFHPDEDHASSKDLKLSGPHAEEAAKDINDAVRKVGNFVYANREKLRQHAKDDFKSDEAQKFQRKITAMTDHVVKKWKKAGVASKETKREADGMALNAYDAAISAKD